MQSSGRTQLDKANDKGEFPRLLLVDITPVGSVSATGQVKAQLLDGWPREQMLQVAYTSTGGLGILGAPGEVAHELDMEEIVQRCTAFAPEVIYYRPLDQPLPFRKAATRILDELREVPLVTHLMDDWPRRMQAAGGPDAYSVDAELRDVLQRSTFRFAIGDKMAKAFEARYGVTFETFANCVDRERWDAVVPDREQLRCEPSPDAPFVLRYSGALAQDMTRQSVTEVAEAIERVAAEIPVHFELRVLPAWRAQAERDFHTLAAVEVQESTRTMADYRAFVAGADACLIAYNFDRATSEYVGLSIANKLPDYLAAGRPILAYGPSDLATIELCRRSGGAEVVVQRDATALDQALRRLATDPGLRQSLGRRGREFVLSNADAMQVRTAFQRRLREAAARQAARERTRAPAGLLSSVREDGASLSEAALMSTLLSEYARDSIMVDVGAHHGSEMKPFVDLGWRVYAFEPDPVNREDLRRRFGRHPRVQIDPRAVSQVDGEELPFYRSRQSTGISTLAPFHDSHVEAGRVTTVRLDRFCTERHIDRIDYLKVDTEGHDLFVLQSLDWDTTPPDAIQTEFEDSKTVPLGYNFHDLARFLLERGYDVWVSEWHPIRAYGTAHDWCRLARYPTELQNLNGWGNLLAFREPVDKREMRAAATEALSSVGGPGHAHSGAPRHSDVREEDNEMAARSPSADDSPPASDPAAALGSAFRGPEKLGMGSGFRELVWVYRGRLAAPSAATAFLYLAASLTALLAPGAPAWVVVLMLAGAGLLTLGSVGIGIARASRERQRASAALVAKVARAIETSSRDAAGADAALRRQLDRLEKRADDALQRSDSARQRTEAALTEVQTTVDRVAATEGHLKTLDITVRKLSAPVGYQSFSRHVAPEESAVLIETWAPRFGLYTDAPPGTDPARHLSYLAERVRLAEEHSIGRLATSTPDMLLRMITARAAGRDAAARGEPLHILEIGTLFGIGLALLGEACRGQGLVRWTLTGVDPLDGYYGAARPDILTGEPVDGDSFMRNMAGFPMDKDAWRLIQRTSHEAREEGAVADRHYGLVVIDGDHTLEGVKYDFEGYRNLMTPGCYVIFDDYGADEWPDVKRYVDEDVSPRADVQFLGSSWRTAVVRTL